MGDSVPWPATTKDTKQSDVAFYLSNPPGRGHEPESMKRLMGGDQWRQNSGEAEGVSGELVTFNVSIACRQPVIYFELHLLCSTLILKIMLYEAPSLCPAPDTEATRSNKRITGRGRERERSGRLRSIAA